MKKLISILLCIACLFCLCACSGGEKPAETGTQPQTTEPSEDPGLQIETEDPLKDVNEMEPVDGVYQIISIKGLQNMAQHPDADFELLCDIDLGGAQWTPLGTEDTPFTGELDGGYFTISNFTIDAPGADGNQGFFGVNKGMIKDLLLADVTITATQETKNIGSMAGVNKGTILRCTTAGTITVDQAAANAVIGGGVGTCYTDIRNSTFDVDVFCNAKSAATVGSIVGSMGSGKLQFSTGSGKLEVASGEGKQVGLLCGSAEGSDMKSAMFLGETNLVDGKLYETWVGTNTGATLDECRARDNSAPALPENIQKLRDTVVDAMYEMATVEWYVSEPLDHSCTCSLAACHGQWQPGMLHKGMPYIHKGGSLARFQYCLDETDTLKDWIYELDTFDGFDMYMGNDCSTAIQQAYARVGNSFNYMGTALMAPYYQKGTIPVGDWEWEMAPKDSRGWTLPYVEETGYERMFEAYALVRKGDSMLYVNELGGHVRMACEDAVVVRDENGKIDPANSYMVMHQQGGVTIQMEPYYTTWGLYNRFTFQKLADEGNLPVSIQELMDGEVDVPSATLENGKEGKAGLTTGTIVASYNLDYVTMVLTDAEGNELINHVMFPSVGKTKDANSNNVTIRSMIFEYDLAHFAPVLKDTYLDPQQEYHCVITANLSTGDQFVVKDYTF